MRRKGAGLANSKRLIIVEDEVLIAEMVRTMVEELGWSVDGIAYSAEEGHDLLSAHRPTVAILDINLGGSTSAGIASICQQREIPIIYITGYLDRVPEGPSVALLAKPFMAEDMAEALSAAETLSGRRVKG